MFSCHQLEAGRCGASEGISLEDRATKQFDSSELTILAGRKTLVSWARHCQSVCSLVKLIVPRAPHGLFDTTSARSHPMCPFRPPGTCFDSTTPSSSKRRCLTLRAFSDTRGNSPCKEHICWHRLQCTSWTCFELSIVYSSVFTPYIDRVQRSTAMVSSKIAAHGSAT